jgi:predicted dienelactone hydrolase
LVTELWFPTDAKPAQEQVSSRDVFKSYPTIKEAKPVSEKLPIILLSHGTGGGRLTMAWLATALARAGYLVAAVDHWGNTFDNPIPEYFIKFWERPQDLSFVLTSLLEDKNWANVIDERSVAAVGFSLGGYTVISAAGGKMDYERLGSFSNTEQGRKEADIPEMPGLLEKIKAGDYGSEYDRVKDKLHDQRIKCVVALSPAIGQGFDKKGLSGIRIPVFIVGAENDVIAPLKTNAAHYAQNIRGSKVTILPGQVGHYVFLNECTDFGKEVANFICSDDGSVNREAIHYEVSQSIISFLNSNLK